MRTARLKAASQGTIEYESCRRLHVYVRHCRSSPSDLQQVEYILEYQTFQVTHHGAGCASGYMSPAEVGATCGGYDVVQDVYRRRQIPLIHMTHRNADTCIDATMQC